MRSARSRAHIELTKSLSGTCANCRGRDIGRWISRHDGRAALQTLGLGGRWDGAGGASAGCGW